MSSFFTSTTDSSGTLFLTMNNEVQGNAFNPAVSEELHQILIENTETIKALVFQSSGCRFFCTGGNLKVYSEMSKEEALEANRRIRKTLDFLHKLPVPTICLIVGDCFGGGVELSSSFDKVLCTPSSFIGLWQRRIALTYGWGGYERLKSRVNRKVLQQLSLEARSLSAIEAQRLGFVDEIHSKNRILDCAKQWVERQLSLPVAPVNAIKNKSSKDEAEVFEALWHNPEHLSVLDKYKK